MVIKNLHQDEIKPFQVSLTDFSVTVSIVVLKLWYLPEWPSQNSHFPLSSLKVILLFLL